MAGTMLLALGGCSLFQPEPLDPPSVSLQALELEAFGLNSQVFRARLRLFNPNSTPLDVSGGELQLELAGIRTAKGRTLMPFVVAPGTDQDVEILVTTHLLRDAPALFTALSRGDGREPLEYRLTGHIDVARRGPDRIPIRAAGQLRLPAGPE